VLGFGWPRMRVHGATADTEGDSEDGRTSVSTTLHAGEAGRVVRGGGDEVVLTPEGHAQLEEEHEGRLQAAGVLEPREPSSQVVSLGSHVTLQDLDDGLREEYLLVSSTESNPTEGRLSADSPVGSAILGRHRGDVVDARAPHRIRHLCISDLSAGARRR
jgi:Transcription elongation factor, GreA/GreB, C-term